MVFVGGAVVAAAAAGVGGQEVSVMRVMPACSMAVEDVRPARAAVLCRSPLVWIGRLDTPSRYGELGLEGQSVRDAVCPRNFGWSKLHPGTQQKGGPGVYPYFNLTLWLSLSVAQKLDDIETQVFDNRIGEAYFTGLQFLYTISARGHQALISPRQ